MRRSSRLCSRGDQWGGGSPCLGPSLCLPTAGNKAGALGFALAMEGVAPIPLWFVLACCHRARSVWRPGVLARVCLSIVVLAGAGGWGVVAGPAPALSRAPGSCRGRGDHLFCLGGAGGRRPRGLRVGGGAGGTGGGVRAVAPLLPLRRVGLRPSAQSLFRRRRIPPRCKRLVGVVGQPWAPGAVCRWRASLARGGGEGRPVSRPPRGVARGPGGRGVVLPRSVPLPSLGGQHCGRHWRRSGHGGRGPHTALVRCRVLPQGVACVSLLRAGAGSPACRDPHGSRQWGARGRAACGSSCVPPPGVTVPSGGGGAPPWPRGGWRASAPAAHRPGGGSEGERGGGAAPLFPTHLPWAASPWPPSLSPFFSSAPPLGIHVQLGLPGRHGRQAQPSRPPVGQCCGGGGWEREVFSPQSAPPPSAGGHQGGLLGLRIPGCRPSVAALGAGAEPSAGRG